MPLQRDQLGRFVHGNSGGPGRPKGTRNPAYLVMVEDVVSLQDWRAILERIKALARTGDPAACKFLANYLLGRPGSADSPQDETEDATALASNLAESPSPFSPAMLKQLDQQLERQKRRADEAADNMLNKHPAQKR